MCSIRCPRIQSLGNGTHDKHLCARNKHAVVIEAVLRTHHFPFQSSSRHSSLERNGKICTAGVRVPRTLRPENGASVQSASHCSCWLDQPLFLYAFMVPVGAVILINTILFSLVIKGISCDRPHNIRSNQNDGDIAAQQARAAVCCFVILGNNDTHGTRGSLRDVCRSRNQDRKPRCFKHHLAPQLLLVSSIFACSFADCSSLVEPCFVCRNHVDFRIPGRGQGEPRVPVSVLHLQRAARLPHLHHTHAAGTCRKAGLEGTLLQRCALPSKTSACLLAHTCRVCDAFWCSLVFIFGVNFAVLAC